MEKRWMLFVDGENFTIRSREVAEKVGIDLATIASLYKRDEYFWPEKWNPRRIPCIPGSDYTRIAERAYYYTAIQAARENIEAECDEFQRIGFHPNFLQKVKGQRAKGVDITLTKDMLVHAFFDNYDIAVLMSGDADFVPVVDELKRMGKLVVVAFYEEGEGLNPALRRVADQFQPIKLDANGLGWSTGWPRR